MHIIFGKHAAEEASEKYTVLPLDRIQIEPSGPVLDTYCILEKENFPLEEIGQMENFHKLHVKLMENYQKKNWNFWMLLKKLKKKGLNILKQLPEIHL